MHTYCPNACWHVGQLAGLVAGHRSNNAVPGKGLSYGNSSRVNYSSTCLILIPVVLAKQTRQGDLLSSVLDIRS